MFSSSTHIKWLIITHSISRRSDTSGACVHTYTHNFLSKSFKKGKRNPEKLYTYVDSTYSYNLIFSLDLFLYNKHPFTVK